MAEHTPGPWQIERRCSNGCERGPLVMAEKRLVAEVAGAPYLQEDGGATTYANARLIAAAPAFLNACGDDPDTDRLKALEGLLEHVERQGVPARGLPQRTFDALREGRALLELLTAARKLARGEG